MKIRPVRAELFHADGQTDMTKVKVVFRNFANEAKNAYRFEFYLLAKPIMSINIKTERRKPLIAMLTSASTNNDLLFMSR